MKSIIVVLTIVIMSLVSNKSARCEDSWSISLNEFPVEKGERVVGFNVKIRAGSIYSLPKIPIGWSMIIENFLNNEPPWNTSIEAVTGIGAGALDQSYFTNFIVVSKRYGLNSEPFDIQITLSTTIDFENEKKRIFSLKDITMKQISAN